MAVYGDVPANLQHPADAAQCISLLFLAAEMVCSQSVPFYGSALPAGGTGHLPQSSPHHVRELLSLFVLGIVRRASCSGETVQSFTDRSICLHSPHQLLFQRRSLFRDSHLRRFSHPAPASCTPVPAADADNWHHLSAFAAGSRSRRVSAAAGGMDSATRQRCFRQLSEPLEPSDARHALELSDIQSLFHWHDLFQHSGDLCHALLSAKGIPVSRRYLWRDSGVSSAAVPHERHDVSGSQGVHSPAATAAVAVRILLEDLTVPPDCPAFHAAAVFRSTGYGYPVPDRN